MQSYSQSNSLVPVGTMYQPYKRRRTNRFIGTRYYSTRPTPGLYRAPSVYSYTGAARRLFGVGGMKKAIKSIAEHKYFDTQTVYGATSGIFAPGQLNLLTQMPQGASDVTRIGDKTTGLSLEVRMEIHPPFLVAQSVLFPMRLLLFIWKDDSAPTAAQILSDPSTAGCMTSPLNHDYKIKRRILHDQVYWTYNDYTGNDTGTFNPYVNCKHYFPLNKYGKLNEINFIGGGSSAINHIYALLTSPTPNAANWGINFYARYNFLDV